MKLFGMQVDSSGKPQATNDRVHVNEIWSRYEAYRAGRGVTGYVLPQANPFHNWHVSNRYAHEANFNQAEVDLHKSGAELIKRLTRKAIIEGRLSV